MKWLFTTAFVFWALAYWAKLRSDRGPCDDFGSAIPCLIAGAIAALLTVTYVALVFWNHRFW